jgi:hypothetical protein
MARYKIDENSVVDTTKAVDQWEEASDWDGSNHYGRSTGSQWHDDSLYATCKGRFYLEHKTRVTGELDSAELISPKEAAIWLLANDYDLPQSLEKFESEVNNE